ncbi:efflux RND transporter periplasmic adaptor subunit [Aquimarina algicola]|uniref:Efflux RND transporter periplasmic adaptor subunit n=1 Tax=Aquimarina algicola TaxID=2589995 RepID=A0A504JET2_9FLAO|nr:efflux RND transporter periplasmic adaptor subunit [Aquimarina algicola]TPN86955.1 efflux RND transporter periplasmic adaptor subunit [Aquimarina algicola]
MNKLFKLFSSIIIISIMQSCSSNKEQKEQEVINVSTVQISPNQENLLLSFSGQLISEDKSTLSFLVGGMIKELHVAEGDHVKKGTLLATLEQTDYSNDLALRKASLLEAQDTYERMKSLYDKKSIPERDYVRAKASFLSAKALVDIAGKKLSDTRLYAPFDGTIFKKTVRKGTVINPSQPIYEIASTNNLEVNFAVPESEINTINIGDRLQTKISALPNHSVTAEITSIINVADATTRSYQVKAKVNNDDNMLKDGMLTEVVVSTKNKVNSISIPGNAVVMSNNNVPHIYVYDAATKKALKTRISIGKVAGDKINIVKGLKGNEMVITEGQHQLRDGFEVNVVRKQMLNAQNL